MFYDLFRVKNGKEHWDVIQETPTKGLANNNGMFGFRQIEKPVRSRGLCEHLHMVAPVFGPGAAHHHLQ